MLLRDMAGNEMVFDLKWTSQKDKYKTCLEKNRALQLAIYKAMLMNHENHPQSVRTAYFVMPLGRLFSIKTYRITTDVANMVKDGADYLQDIPIIRRLTQLRRFRSNEEQEYSSNLLGYQSISALVESLVIELDLYALVQSWDNAQAEETNLQVFIDLARKYEDYSSKMAQPATISGFISFFTGQKQKGAANEDGVRLFTYHKSKETCPGNYSLVFNPSSEHYAGRHGDQLDCYQCALEAEGKKQVKARIIYYPVTTFVVEVKSSFLFTRI